MVGYESTRSSDESVLEDTVEKDVLEMMNEAKATYFL